MASYSILSKLIAGVQSGVDFATNTLVVQNLNVGGASESGAGGTILSKTILDAIVALQGQIAGATNGQTLQSNGAAGTFFSNILIATGGSTSIDYNNRQLVDSAANTAIQWSTAGTILVGTTAASQVTIGGTSSTGIQKINGGLQLTTKLVSSNYAVDASTKDYFIDVNTGTTITVTLPSPTSGRVIVIKDSTGTASTHNITVSPHASETIDGAASLTINTNYGSSALFSDGTNWLSFGSAGGSGSGITALTGDVTATGPGSAAATVAKIQGTVVSGTTGSGNVVFSASPTFTGTITAAIANFSGAISASNFSGSSSGTNSGDQTITLTGDVTGSGTGSFAATIASNAVTSAKFRQSVALSLVGNATNATANVTDIAAGSDFQIMRRSGTALAFGSIDLSQSNAVGASILGVANGGTGVASVTTAPAATAFAGWDANKNLSANNHLNGFTSIATAATTTTLTVSSTGQQTFTGSTTQTVTLPVATTLVNGQSYLITNLSTGVVTVQTSGSNSIQAMASNTSLLVTCINTAGGTGTASWSWLYAPAQSSALGIAQGGTGAVTKSAAFDALSPMTTQGDIIFGNASGTGTRLGRGSANQLLAIEGSNTIPTWKTIYETNSPNYIAANPNAEQDTTGWATYSNTAQNIPVNGTGGTATGLTFSRSTSTPLRGTGQFSLVQANSTSLQGKGVSYDFTIDAADKAKVMTVTFDFNASSTFVASNGITAPLNDGTTSTNAGNSDIEVFAYDKTNSQLIYLTPQVIAANGTNNFTFEGTFQTNSNSTSYRLIFHVATANANATGWTFLFDNVYVGRLPVSLGAPVLDWVAYTPTISAGFGTTTNVSFFYRRVGDTCQVQGYFTAGTVAASLGSISLPSSLNLDTTKLSVNNTTSNPGLKVGDFVADGAANREGAIVTCPATSTTLVYYAANYSNTSDLTPNNVNSNIVNNSNNSIQFTVPVLGWSSSTQMSNTASTRVVEAAYFRTSNTSNTANTQINFDTVIYDTHGAVTTGASWKFTAPVSGYYLVQAIVATNNTQYTLQLYKNGSNNKAVIGVTNTSGFTFSGSVKVLLAAGDTIDLRNDTTANITGTASTASGASAVYISLDLGPSQLAVVESVNMKYYNTAGTSITSSFATVPFATKDYDSHNAFVGSTGIYTVPVSGKYSVKSHLAFQGVALVTGNPWNIKVQQNSSDKDEVFQVTENNNSNSRTIQVNTTLNCVAGDTINIQAKISSSVGLDTTTYRCVVCIERIGN